MFDLTWRVIQWSLMLHFWIVGFTALVFGALAVAGLAGSRRADRRRRARVVHYAGPLGPAEIEEVS